MKEKDKLRLDTTRLLLSAIQYEEMQKKVDTLPDAAIVPLLQREVGRRKEEFDFAEKANRSDLKERLLTEIKIIEEFLPRQLNETELEKIITDIKSADSSANLGVAMKNLKERYPGQYDGSLASQIAKKIFG